MSETRRTGVRLALLVAVTLVVASIAAAGVMEASSVDDEPALVVELEGDGDATVTLVSVYDLEDDDEQAAFEELQDDEEALAEFADRFEDRLAAVADETASTVDREMTVSGGTTDVRTTDDRGIVEVSVEWSALAAVEDDRLTVTEPFASGFESDRPLVLVAPDDATLETTSPDADDVDGDAATWAADTDLQGFEAVFEIADDGTDDGADDGQSDGTESQEAGTEETADESTGDDSLSGFGLSVAAIALITALVVSRRRRV